MRFLFFIIFVILISISLFYYYTETNTLRFRRSLFHDPCYVNKNKKQYVLKYYHGPLENQCIFQLYHKFDKIPQDVYENIRQYAPDYYHIVMDDKMIEDFLIQYYHPIVLSTFRKIKGGAHKADLARYCLLYIYGGIYMDIKTELIKPVNDVFKYNTLYSVLSHSNDHIYQGIIKTEKEHPLFLSLIDFIVNHVYHSYIMQIDYHIYCKDFYHQLLNDNIDHNIKQGQNRGQYGEYYLFKENCSKTDCSMCWDGFDRYGFCCFIWDGDEPIIKSRRASYPW